MIITNFFQNPCTKGIWIWGEPIPLTEQIDLILLDTEGLNSYKRDEQIDAKLFLLTNLLSSTLIYNVFHNIDERALEQLSFITSISSLFLDQEKNKISQQFPNLIWLVRDFSLNFTNKQNQTLTSKQYMENQLRLAEGQTEEIQDCHTLVRPVIEEEKLRNIEKLQYSELRSTFKNEGINSQRMPQITSLQERVILKEYNRILQTAKEYFNELIEQEILQKMPLNESEINEIFQQISEKSKKVLDRFTYSQELYTEGLVKCGA
ncbi:P-loop containing nucleoside triphosphate hydrolase [Pseudocohnilembus persalinus]|uniref:p-loop containing nucleoside triphosphate hydrolase n=1 Tax=Pseudocohnilembus persalinus TaxID=266149 RepID=A0A0V0Q9W2_PSEPJ|nr:P-loop containing nucleoside triphosphate hydrolase [Pseudocohnilembus persalinus]|eukprot:KRW99017.1 P-loop containing nucleoside triphosphate hydrolase [Pseudocohnilembus persalinus]